jgi:hypothetical protein
MLRVVLDRFDKTQGNATKTVSTTLRRAYSAISSKSKSQKHGSQTQSKKSRGADSHKLDAIQEHEAAFSREGVAGVHIYSLSLSI